MTARSGQLGRRRLRSVLFGALAGLALYLLVHDSALRPLLQASPLSTGEMLPRRLVPAASSELRAREIGSSASVASGQRLPELRPRLGPHAEAPHAEASHVEAPHTEAPHDGSGMSSLVRLRQQMHLAGNPAPPAPPRGPSQRPQPPPQQPQPPPLSPKQNGQESAPVPVTAGTTRAPQGVQGRSPTVLGAPPAAFAVEYLPLLPGRRRQYADVTAAAVALFQQQQQRRREGAVRPARLLVAVISGGSNETLDAARAARLYKHVNVGASSIRGANRQAVLDTWGPDTWFVTREPVATRRVITLPEAFEAGGREALPDKVREMWRMLHRRFLLGTGDPQQGRVDWFMKADDDTYVHRTRLDRTLALLDPAVPLHLGRQVGGGGVGAGFCHGGSGYILSRGLLARVGPHLSSCFEGRARHWEDLWLKNCVAHTLSLGTLRTWKSCSDTTALGFDGLFSNGKDQAANGALANETRRTRAPLFSLQTTFHSAYAPLMADLHAAFDAADADAALTLAADDRTYRHLEANRPAFTAGWRCPVPLHRNLPDWPTSALSFALCQQTAIRVPPAPLASPERRVPRATWTVFRQPSPTGVDNEAQAASPSNVVAGKRRRMQGFLRVDVLAEWPAPEEATTSTTSVTETDSGSNKESSVGSSSHTSPTVAHGTVLAVQDAVLVRVGPGGAMQSVARALQLLVHSLRVSGSAADVVVFTARRITRGVGTGVRMVLQDGGRAGQGALSYEQTQLSAMAQFVHRKRDTYARLVQVPVFTFFQADPFAALFWPAEGGDDSGDGGDGGDGSSSSSSSGSNSSNSTTTSWPAAGMTDDEGADRKGMLARDSRLKLFLSGPLPASQHGGHPWAFDANGASQDFVIGPSTGPATCGDDWHKGTVRVSAAQANHQRSLLQVVASATASSIVPLFSHDARESRWPPPFPFLGLLHYLPSNLA